MAPAFGATELAAAEPVPAGLGLGGYVLVVAAGKAGVVGAEHVSPGQTVIDVGIHMGEDGKLCGDVRTAEVETVVAAVTPVPGGVGSVTTAVLASHVIEAAEAAGK